MPENDRMKKAEQHITDELANEARQQPGSEQGEQAKEKRAQAEKELANARDPGQKNKK